MYLKELKIKNFRNIESQNIELNKNVNIFIGNNAQGKTSILESIYVLALSKSSKNVDENNLIKMNSDFSKIFGVIQTTSSKKNLEIVLTKNQKILRINKNEIRKISEYISNLNIIMFSPDDLDIVKKSPSIRRSLINTTLCQLYPNYLRILSEYNKLLKIRNEYLKKDISTIDKLYFEILTDKLIDRALIIMEYRDKFINDINLNINNIYYKIMKEKGLKVSYIKSIDINTKEDLKKVFKDSFREEFHKKMTFIGPHRDDISFMLDDVDLKLYGSQGQQRTSILAFKLSEIDLFKKILGFYPVVLLDDIFSELDIEKRNNLLKFIKSNIQFIITTTDIKNISSKIIDKAKVFVVEKGKIKEGAVYGKQ